VDARTVGHVERASSQQTENGASRHNVLRLPSYPVGKDGALSTVSRPISWLELRVLCCLAIFAC